MFSLIITAVSIALVAALALATLYFGGTAYQQSATKTEAAKAVSQSVQVLGAAELFKVEHGRWPDSMQELVTLNYLTAGSIAMGSGVKAVEWEQPLKAAPTFWTRYAVAEDTCRRVNLQARGDDGIYVKAKPGLVTQCFGLNQQYTVVTTREAPDAPGLDVIFDNWGDPSLDYAEDGGGWRVPPTTFAPGGVDSGTSNGGYFGDSITIGVGPGGDGTAPGGGNSVNLGDLVAGGSGNGSFTITNTGKGNITIGTPSAQGPVSVTGSTCTGSLEPGQSCSVNVGGTGSGLIQVPTSEGTLNVGVSAGQGNAVVKDTAPLEMTLPAPATPSKDQPEGLVPEQQCAADNIFPPTPIGLASYQWVRVTNVGDHMVFDSPKYQVTAPFYVTSTTCQGELAPGNACLTRLMFKPTEQVQYGAADHYYRVFANKLSAKMGLSGCGVAPVGAEEPAPPTAPEPSKPTVALSTAVVEFGKVPTNLESSQYVVVGVEGSTGHLTIDALPVVSGASAFRYDEAASTCTGEIAVGTACNAQVTVKPTTSGALEGTLTLKFAEQTDVTKVELRGEGYNPVSLSGLSGPLEVGRREQLNYDFKPHFTAAHETEPVMSEVTWSAKGLPAGFSLNSATGELSGTSDVAMSKPLAFSVTATYQNNKGLQNYEMQVVLTPLTDVRSVTTGVYHTCALLNSGGVKCWGNDNSGQLGDGKTATTLSPVQVSGLDSGVVKVTLGTAHTCALLNSGGVLCWGDSSYGQLGDNTNRAKGVPTPVVELTSGVIDLDAGRNHTCALLATGGVKCWGSNSYGQLGDGTQIARWVPTQVKDLSSGVTSISGGGNAHTCAVLSTGGVKCWGYSNYGQVGDGFTTHRFSPVSVQGLSERVVSVDGGSYHTCALLESGAIECWGDNGSGQLGDGTTTGQKKPIRVSGLAAGAVAVTAGEAHTCALLTTGGLQCWGRGGEGQLGDGASSQKTVPVQVSGLASGVAAVSAGLNYTCAVLTSGGVKCWGKNDSSQIGGATGTTSYSPRDVYN